MMIPVDMRGVGEEGHFRGVGEESQWVESVGVSHGISGFKV